MPTPERECERQSGMGGGWRMRKKTARGFDGAVHPLEGPVCMLMMERSREIENWLCSG